MAETKRTEKQRQEDCTIIAKYMVQGFSVRNIAEMLNQENEQNDKDYSISKSQVMYDMKSILKEWQEERKDLIDLVVDRELKKLDVIEAECWQAWEKSKQGKRTTTIAGGQVINNQAGGGAIKERKIEETNGEIKYVTMILACMDRRRDLLGYAAPKKVEFSGSVGVGMTPMSEDEIAKEKERIKRNLKIA